MRLKHYFCFKFCILLLIPAISNAHTHQHWSGYYAGAGIGGVYSDIKFQTTLIPGGTYFNDTTDAADIKAAGYGRLLPWKFSGSVFAGYNRLFENILTGAEAGLNTLFLDDSQTVNSTFVSDPNIRFVIKQTFKATFQGTLRARLGITRQNWLTYLAGGVAVANIRYTSAYVDDNANAGSGLPGAFGSGTKTRLKLGWTIGVGGVYMVSKVLGIKAEYQYADFGSLGKSYIITPTPTLSEFSSSFSSNAKFTNQTITVGIVYHFW